MDMNRIRVATSPLSGQIHIYRHGKDPHIALDRRDCTQEAIIAFAEMMLHDSPKGARVSVRLGDKACEIVAKPMSVEDFEAERVLQAK